MDCVYEVMGRVFKVLGFFKFLMFISVCKISEIIYSFDSLDFIEMLIEVEKMLGILIDEMEFLGVNFCNIGDVVLVFVEKMVKVDGKIKVVG